MKSATVRDVQHNLAKVLAWVAQGEEVQITRRNKPVAKLVPAGSDIAPVELPDFCTRARAIWGLPSGAPLSTMIIDDREERL